MSHLFRLQPSGRLRPVHLIDTGYQAGAVPSQEAQLLVPAGQRYVRLSGVAADTEYSFEVAAVREVDADINVRGFLLSSWARVTRGRFQPATTTKLAGIEAGATRGAVAGANLFRADGSTVLTQSEIRTAEGTAAAISGQGPWATSSIPTTRVSNLSDGGTFNSLLNVTDRDLALTNNRAWTNLYRANGSTPITDADAITSLGTAAAITGQAPAATDTTIQAGADVTAFVSGTPNYVFNYTSTGVLDPSNQLPRALDYRFNTLAGVRTTGVTWQYRIVSGNVNGFAASSTLRTMSVASGVGTLNITALDTNSAELDIIGTVGTQSVTYRTVLAKAFAAPNNTGGGGGSPATASQTSGFLPIGFGQTTYMTISEVLQVTAVTTTLTATVNLAYSLDSESDSTSFELQIERWNGSAWVAFGASETRVAFRFYDTESLELYENSANWGFSRTVAVTAGTVQQVRLRLRRSAGDDMSAGGYGTFNISA